LFQRNLVPIVYTEIEKSIKKCARDLQLQATDSFMAKVIQLYEMMNARHGLMLVGPPLSAKTSAYKLLSAALTDLAYQKESENNPFSPVSTHILNPKSLDLTELYGSFDPISHEFSDGVLGKMFRECASQGRA
jgi:dynein heavy chain